MGLVVNIYEPYVIIENVEYYKIGDVADIIKKSIQTIKLWDNWSDELEQTGMDRLIPKCTRVGKQGVRCWNAKEIDEIKYFSTHIKYGDLAKFSRTRWGERANYLSCDKSTEYRNATKEYRKTVNKQGKQYQQRKRIQEIKSARRDMLKLVRRRAKSIYDSMDTN